MQLLAKITTGSHLYGLNHATSDFDWKGIGLPSLESLILQRGERSENKGVVGGEDGEIYSLQRFCDLLIQGQPVAIEMISAGRDKWLVSSPEWERLCSMRKQFYTKKMQAFLGYSRGMASKYSSRAERMETTEKVLSCLRAGNENDRLSTIWDSLPVLEGVTKEVNERNKSADNRAYNVFGRQLQATVTISHAINVVSAIHQSYGSRVKAAKDMDYADFKSLHHAFRVCYQVKQICQTGELSFPLSETPFLMDLKMGRVDFASAGLDKKLDDLMSEVEKMIDSAALPDRVDSKVLNSFILEVYREKYGLGATN